MTTRKIHGDGGLSAFVVSYYVEAERYWQFAGQFEDRKQALARRRVLMDGRPLLKVRVRRV